MKTIGKRRAAAMLIIIVILLLGCIGVFIWQQGSYETQETAAEVMDITTGEGGTEVLTGEGTTQISAQQVYPDFDVTVADVIIEEVYVEVGTVVTPGDALYKVSEESLAEELSYYEQEIAKAEKTLSTANSSYSVGVKEAEYTYQNSLNNAEYAGSTYESAISELDADIEEKKNRLDEANEDISMYQTNLDNNIYYSSNKIEEKQQAAESAAAVEQEKQTADAAAKTAYEEAEKAVESNIKAIQDLAQGELTAESQEKLITLSGQLSVSYENQRTKAADYQKAQSELQQAQTAKQKANEELETANQQYQKDTEEAYQKLAELNSQLEELTSAYEQAERKKVTEQVTLKKEYDEAVLEGQYAKTVYNNTVAELQNAVDEAEEQLENLNEARDALLQIENGIICADREGTLASVAYEVGDIFYAKTAYVSYYDTETITIAVEVSQENIAALQVGDTVSAAISGAGRGNVQGEIISIASEATSGGSVSDVTYTVTVAIDNSEEALSAGQSAVIYFTENLQAANRKEGEERK